MPDPKYYIVCRSPHGSEYALFWKPDARGYTRDLKQAGRYAEVVARQICPDQGISQRGEDFMLPCAAVDALAIVVAPFGELIDLLPAHGLPPDAASVEGMRAARHD